MNGPEFTGATLRITHEPGASILNAAWAPRTSEEQARSDYGDLLAAARAFERCRFWLVSLQEYRHYSVEFCQWYSRIYAPNAVRTLGHPIFVAYCVPPAELKRFVAALDAVQKVCAQYDFHPYAFDSQEAARTWMQCQQEHDPAPGEGPVALELCPE